jgi:hypothetical protein
VDLCLCPLLVLLVGSFGAGERGEFWVAIRHFGGPREGATSPPLSQAAIPWTFVFLIPCDVRCLVGLTGWSGRGCCVGVARVRSSQ